ncbi:MAG: hypothetical protein H6923_06640 [Alphaproteobacteria bacterium]|nr:hypothetical protein [Alphaproteobacteria bacterium]
MTTYHARVLDAETGGEGRYTFEGPADLFKETPARIVRAFMDHVFTDILPTEKNDWELNAALKNPEREVVTAMGAFHFANRAPSPFLIMISSKG